MRRNGGSRKSHLIIPVISYTHQTRLIAARDRSVISRVMLSVAHVAMTATTVAPLAPVNFWMLMSSDQKAKGRLTAFRDGILSPEADEASVRQRLQDADQHAVAVELSEEPDWWTRVTSGEGTCVISLK